MGEMIYPYLGRRPSKKDNVTKHQRKTSAAMRLREVPCDEFVATVCDDPLSEIVPCRDEVFESFDIGDQVRVRDFPEMPWEFGEQRQHRCNNLRQSTLQVFFCTPDKSG